MDVTRPAATSGERDRAVERLARTAGRRGYAIAVDLVGDAAEAEDAVQEALARACAGWGRLRDPEALEGWFFKVLTNVCMRTLRRRRYARALGWLGRGRPVRVPGDADEATKEFDVADDAPAPDDELARARDVATTMKALDVLPPMQRTAVVLRYGHDLSVEQVAAAMGIGAGTVKTHLVRALRRLREQTT